MDFTKDSKFKGLFSDITSSRPADGHIYNGIIREVDGEKVGIFGLTTSEGAALSSPGSIAVISKKLKKLSNHFKSKV